MGQRVYVGRTTRQCEECGVDVNRKASSFKEHVFCGRECYLRSPHHSVTVARANAVRQSVDGRTRLENLELWSVSQPKGQRVEDKVAWAREFLAEYEGMLFI